jgi:hypothetical protein
MSQKDIEPLREICYCLGISSLSPPYNNPSVHETVPLNWPGTGEVSQMSQKDIEPLREICYCLGISSLITRLDDVKLTISFQVTHGLNNYKDTKH